eukprot:11336411-Heterocapsa_arctica.AAC.1
MAQPSLGDIGGLDKSRLGFVFKGACVAPARQAGRQADRQPGSQPGNTPRTPLEYTYNALEYQSNTLRIPLEYT